MDRGGHGRDEGAEEVRRDPAGCFLVQLSERELARAVDGPKQVKPALLGVHLGDVDVTRRAASANEADRVGLEAGVLGLVPVRVGPARDAVALQAAVQR